MVNIVATNSPNVDGYNFKELDDDNILFRQLEMSSWGEIQNRADTWKLLSFLSGFQTTSMSKKPEWAIGDEETRSLTLAAGFVLPSTDGGKVTVTLSESHVADNQLLYIREDLSANGVAEAIIRYRDATGNESKRVQFVNSTGTAAANRTFTTSATVTTLPNNAEFDGKVGAGIELAPEFINNAMMRSREAVQVGTHTHSDNLITDVSIEKQAKMKMYKVMRDMNSLLWLSNNKKVAAQGFADFGMVGGFDYFFRPDNTSMTNIDGTTLTGLKGVRKLTTSTTISSNMLDEWMIDFTEYGSDEKVLVANPTVINKFVQMAKREGILQYGDRFGSPNIDNYFAAVQSIETAFGKLWLVPDRGATGIYKYITDGTLSLNSTSMGIVFDKAHTRIIHHNATKGKINKGVQSLKLLPVDTTADNNSVDKMEWDTTWSLMIDDPRTGGYIGFGAS